MKKPRSTTKNQPPEATKAPWQDFEVKDMVSACRVHPDTLTFSEARGEISVQIHDIDVEDYHRRARRAPGKVTPVCLKSSQAFTVELKDLCPTQN